MKLVCLFVFACSFNQVFAQYYFNEIVAQQQSAEQYKLMRLNKIKKVNAINYNSNNEVIENFEVEQDISNDGKKMVTTTIINKRKQVITNTYTNNLLTSSIQDNSKIIVTTNYAYNSQQQIASITTSSIDTAVNFSNIEVHEWVYNQQQKPIQMRKIKNGKDTMIVAFVLDEKGNVAEEQWKRNNKTMETFYYYYNEKNALTDVVKYNSLAKKLLPDFVFEYDNNGRVIKTIQTTKAGNYLIWLTTYLPNGLKQAEECFNKQKQFSGKVVYQYQ